MTNEKWEEIKKYLLYAIFGEGDPVERPADMDYYEQEIGMRLNLPTKHTDLSVQMFWKWLNYDKTGEHPTIRRGRILAAKEKLFCKTNPMEAERWDEIVKYCYITNMSHLLADLFEQYNVDIDLMDEIWFTLEDIKKDMKTLESCIANSCGEDDPRIG